MSSRILRVVSLVLLLAAIVLFGCGLYFLFTNQSQHAIFTLGSSFASTLLGIWISAQFQA